MTEKKNRRELQCHCRGCGHWLPIEDILLCDRCYSDFFSWASRRPGLHRVQENPLETWLRERRKEKK